jgi:hypothetical protein
MYILRFFTLISVVSCFKSGVNLWRGVTVPPLQFCSKRATGGERIFGSSSLGPFVGRPISIARQISITSDGYSADRSARKPVVATSSGNNERWENWDGNESRIISSIIECTRVSEIDGILSKLQQNATVIDKPTGSENNNIGDALVLEGVPLNVAVAAFSRTMHLSGQLQDPKLHKQGHPLSSAIETQRTVANSILPKLFRTIKQSLQLSTSPNPPKSEFRTPLSTSSSLYLHGALARLIRRKPTTKTTDLYAVPSRSIAKDAIAIPLQDTLLMSNDVLTTSIFPSVETFIRQAGSHRLYSFLWAITALRTGAVYDNYLKQDSVHVAKELDVLLNQIGNRLAASDAIGAASISDYCTGIWCFVKLGMSDHKCIPAFLRRLRKGAVLDKIEPSDVLKVTWACSRAVTLNDQRKPSASLDKIRIQLQLTCSALLGHLVSKIEAGDPSARLAASNVGRIIALFKQIDTLEVEFYFEQQRTLLSQILEDGSLVQKASLEQIAFLLRKQAELGIKNGNWVRELGVRMNALLLENDEDPAVTLSTILRSVAIMFPGRQRGVNKEFLKGGSTLLTDDYIQSLNQNELANVLWSLARCKYDDQRVLFKMGRRALEDDILESCTASSSGKILWAFATVVPSCTELGLGADANLSSTGTDGGTVTVSKLDMQRLELDLFQQLGPLLLSNELTTNDISAAMWAMAKASYPLDMGVFDHLARLLSNPPHLNGAKTRQLTEALWACGKMATWEDPLREQIEFGKQTPPPYLDSAMCYAVELSQRTASMTTKDIAQSIWAAARLGLATRKDVIREFGEKAKQEAGNFNGIEVANTIWGLSKLGYDDSDLVQKLMDRVLDPEIRDTLRSQEAANILYALGKLNEYNEEVFDAMCAALMRNLNDATPQAIANALWAHETVGIDAPQGLFDSWAQKRLGIVGPLPGSVDFDFAMT